MIKQAAPPSAVRSDSNPTLAMRIWVQTAPFAFLGPYVALGLRTEQIYLYASMGIALVSLSKLPSLIPGPIPFIALLTFPVLIAGVGLVEPTTSTMRSPTGGLNYLDNLVIPIAVVMTVWMWRRSLIASALVKLLAPAVLLALSLAALVSLIQFLNPDIARPLISAFVTAQGFEGSVASLAEGAGRYGGIFNQPAEAGLAFATGLLVAVYQLLTSRTGPLLFLYTGLIVVGGLLSESKVFLLGGLPLAAVLSLSLAFRLRRGRTLLGMGAVFVAASQLTLGIGWANRNNFGFAFFASDSRAVADSLSAGRYGANATTGVLWEAVISASPIAGLGLYGPRYPTDSQWGEYLAVAGLLGVICWVSIVMLLGLRLVRLRPHLEVCGLRLALGLLTLLVGASFGISSITCNRAGALIWSLVVVLLVAGGLSNSSTGSASATRSRFLSRS